MTDPTGPAEPITPADTEPSAATRRPEGTPPTSDLWSRLKQHKVVQWTLAYVALAYTLLHGAEMLGGALGWPHGLQRVLALALILGTPIVAVVAWYHGARGQQRVTGTELLIVASLLALGGTYIWRAQSARETHMTAIDNAAATTSLAAPAEASIAVLAFADMSPGKDQEYFSDGMAEEILNALAKVPGLKVAGRTSSFSFKGKNIDSKTIGETLDVAQILEGSVRKQGERVRITAQLLRAKDGFNVWSDSYDGTLADIFDLQERIARDIAGHLKVVLVSQDSRLVPKATNNTAAYTAFVEAEGLVNRRQDLTHAIDLLSDATTLDPRFARAWSKLAVANAVAPLYSDLSWPAGWAAGEAAARHALALDPASAESYAALGYMYLSQRRYAEMDDAFEQAIRLEARNPTALFWRANSLFSMGRTLAAEELIDRLLKNDPINPTALMYKGVTQLINGDLEQAQQASERSDALGYPGGRIGTSLVATRRGDQVAGEADFVRGWGAIHSAFSPQDLGAIYRGVNGDAQSRAMALAIVDSRSMDPLAPTMFLYLSQPEKAFAAFQKYKTGLSDAFLNFLWLPTDWSRYARQHPSFQIFAQQLSMTAYWKKSEWPDLCRPAPNRGPDAFDCIK